MIRKRNLLTVGGTLFCALGIGYFMQRDAPAHYSPYIQPPSGLQQSVLAPSGRHDVDDYAMLDVSEITLTSALPGLPTPVRLYEPALEVAETGASAMRGQQLPEPPAEPEHPKLGCDVTASSAVIPMARVALSVEAPCFPNQRVTIHHSGLFFTDITDENGALDVSIPALAEQAVFIIEFENGSGAVARAKVDELMDFERVAIQWGGQSGLHIHAREFGAAYGETGHVWTDGTLGGHGSVVRLGAANVQASQMAEIYTFPRQALIPSGTITLSIEAEVTTANCNRNISAQSLELRGDHTLRTRDVTLSMPDCDATGDFLVLNNLVEDLKIAGK